MTNGCEHLYNYGTMILVILNQCAPIPAGTIVMFDSTPPPGWQVLTDFTGRFPLGTTTYGGTLGGTSTHTHTISGTTTSGSTIPNCGGVSWSIYPMDPHTHTFSVTTDPSSHIPPYRTFIFAKALSDFNALPRNAVVMSYYAPTRPEWDDITTTMMDRFPRGDPTPGLIGGAATHTHTYAGRTDSSWSYSSDIADYGSTYHTPYRSLHDHTFSGTTGAASNIPPYRTVRFWRANRWPAFIDSCRIILMFDTLPSCTYFNLLPEFNGRIPRANTSTGSNGGSTSHSHTFSFTTSTYYGPSVWTGGAVSYHLPHGHSHSASGTTSSASHMPPYRTVIFATYCGPFGSGNDLQVSESSIRWKGTFTYVLYSPDGKVIRRGKAKGSLDVSGLPSGVYIAVLRMGDTFKTVKLVRRR